MAEFKEGIEIERKYIIMKPDVELLRKQEGYTVSEIRQTYLASSDAVTRRVRHRRYKDADRYYETIKMRVDGMSSLESEREVSCEEYELLLRDIKAGTSTIIKERHTFEHLGHTIEIDIYPEWCRTAILEVELPTRDTPVRLPSFISVLREVTGNKGYSNASMAKQFPPEDSTENVE